MSIAIDRCVWCGRRTGDRSVVLRAPDDEGCLQSAGICPGCYREAMREPGFTPVRVLKSGDRRVVRMPEAADLGAEGCRFAAERDGG